MERQKQALPDKPKIKKTVEIDTSAFLPKLIIKHKLPMTRERLEDARGTMKEIVTNALNEEELLD